MTQDALESLLRKARKAEPPPALKSLILNQATRGAEPPNGGSRRPSSPVFPWAWSLIAAGWVVILSLWSTTPSPLPDMNSPLLLSSAQSEPSDPGHTPNAKPSLFFPTLELLTELGLALDSFEPTTAPLVPELRSHL
jgi:hypothetical protein